MADAETIDPADPAATTGNGKSRTAAAPARTRMRSRRGGEAYDEFAIDPKEIPPGQTWEWKRYTVSGQIDAGNYNDMLGQGWLPVPAKAIRRLAAPDAAPESSIIHKGMILMERPEELTQEAKDEERAKAVDVIRSKEEQLNIAPTGQFARDKRAGAGITKTVEQGLPIED